MTDTPASPAVPAAWYPDPYGAPLNRWWDGSSWTDHVQPRVAETEHLAVVERVEPSFLENFDPVRPAGWYPHPTNVGQQRWWDGNDWTEHVTAPAYAAYTMDAAPLVTHASPSTPQIWAIVIIYAVLAFGGAAYVYAMLSSPAMLLGSDTSYAVGQLGLGAVGLAAWIASAILAYSDSKELASRGVAQPFHWAFTCIPSYGPTIYIIGRSVVARRRTGWGIAPMWWHIGTYAGGTVLMIVAAVVAISSYSGLY